MTIYGKRHYGQSGGDQRETQAVQYAGGRQTRCTQIPESSGPSAFHVWHFVFRKMICYIYCQRADNESAASIPSAAKQAQRSL